MGEQRTARVNEGGKREKRREKLERQRREAFYFFEKGWKKQNVHMHTGQQHENAHRVEGANDAVVRGAHEALAAAVEANGVHRVLRHFHLLSNSKERRKRDM